jgi:hypothetical protein
MRAKGRGADGHMLLGDTVASGWILGALCKRGHTRHPRGRRGSWCRDER